MYTLAIDLGGSFVKAGLFDQSKKKLLVSSRYPFPNFIKTLGPEREVPIQSILNLVRTQIYEMTSSVSEPIDLWISNQMQGFVLVDPIKKTAQGNFISWQDQRSVQWWDDINQCYSEATLKVIGNELHVGHAATTLYAINRQRMVHSGLMPISIGDFIILSLTGQLVGMHETNAAGFGCWSIRDSNWDEWLIDRLGLKQLVWPVVESNFKPKPMNRNWMVYGAVGDFQASLFGAGLEDSQALSVNVATGSQVSRVVSKDLDLDGYRGQLRPYFFGKMLNCITHLPAGRALKFILSPYLQRENLGLDDIFKMVDEDPNPTTSLKVDLRFFKGNGNVGGSISNILESNLSSKSLLIACLQEMAEVYLISRDRIDPKRESTFILGSGGIFNKSLYLQRLLEQNFRLKAKFAGEAEDALWGLFKLSLLNRAS